MKTFSGSTFKELRVAAGKSVNRLALEADLSRASIDSYEKGVSVPSGNTLYRLALILGISMDEFFK
jgi:transcriptional regulator with XRE-family HTH domain